MKDEHDNLTAELAIKPAAKSPAQRQREYRERARKELSRIDMRIGFAANLKLEDMAEWHGCTKREMLERIITDAATAWEAKIGPTQYNDFIDKKINGDK